MDTCYLDITTQLTYFLTFAASNVRRYCAVTTLSAIFQMATGQGAAGSSLAFNRDPAASC